MNKVVKFLSIALAGIGLAACSTPVDLNGAWNIVEVNGEQITAVEEAPFIEFDTENQRVHGNTGVNIMNGSYTLDGEKLSLGKMATTMMAGPMEAMETERIILQTIEKSAKIKASGEDLQILDADGTVIMLLKKKQ